jgi:hypothetical protein
MGLFDFFRFVLGGEVQRRSQPSMAQITIISTKRR